MRSSRVAIALIGLLGVVGRELRAQTMLQIKPRMGDTLRMRLEPEGELAKLEPGQTVWLVGLS